MTPHGFSPGDIRDPAAVIDDQLTVILQCNHRDMLTDALAIDIAGLYKPALKRPERTDDPAPQTTDRLRSVFDKLLRGEHDPADFTAAMRLHLSNASAGAFWPWYAEHGPLRAFAFSDEETRDGLRILRYAVILRETRHWFTFRVPADGRIAQIYWW